MGSALAAAMLLAGCGSSSKSTSNANSTGTASGKAATGSPIPVMVFNNGTSSVLNLSEVDATYKVYVNDYLNPGGGINGHPVQLNFCDDQTDPNKATACGREATSQNDVAALGGLSVNGDAFIPAIQSAGIPYVGQEPLAPDDFSSPVAFPLVGGTPVEYVGLAGALAKTGCSKIGLIIDTGKTFTALIGYTRTGAQNNGAQLVTTVQVPAGTTDMAAPYAKLQSAGAKCAVIGLTTSDVITFVNAVEQSGSPMPLAAGTGNLTNEAQDAISASNLKGILMASASYGPGDTNVADVQQFVAAMKAHGQGVLQDAYSLDAWGTAQTVFAAMKTMSGPITASGLSAKLNGTCPIATKIFGQNVCLNKPAVSASGYNRLFNSDFFLYKYGSNKNLELQGTPTPITNIG
jgi:ABC-type branched-subunit amino acid transport system substrate-binding protein